VIEKASVLCVLVLSALAAFGQEANFEFSRDAIGVKTHASAPRLAERAGILPGVTLAPATEAVPGALAQLRRWNDKNRRPLQNGFTRTIADPISVRLDAPLAAKSTSASLARGVAAMSDRGTIIWSGSIEVRKAYRIRLHLTNVHLPEGATLWVWGAGETPIAFGSELLDQSSIYAPSTGGEVVHLEIEIPSPKGPEDSASFEIRDLMEIVAPGSLYSFAPRPEDDPTCLVDAACTSSAFSQIAAARAAVAHIEYVKGFLSYICSGGLLNDKDTSTVIPYFLSANHCFSTQSAATALEAFWDYRPATCGGNAPDLSTLQRSNGSTLLATSATSDFVFVRLNSIPSGRVLLAWNAFPVPDGTVLHRISHPHPSSFSVPAPQRYSSTAVSSSFGECSTLPQTNFLYSTGGEGGTYEGSSGAPAILDNGQVVGQLLGVCGPNPFAGCDKRNATVDGRFSVTFPLIEQYINTGGSTQSCTPDATTICLNNDRFAVHVDWRISNGQTGTGTGIKYTADSGLFWFFSEQNIEMLVKVLNACQPSVGNRFWVFSAATTNVQYTITVTDTHTSTVKTYFHPLGSPAPAITDTNAFATCP